MVFSFVTRGPAGLDGPLDGSEEVLPAGIAERLLKITGKPEFQVCFLGVRLSQLVKLALHFDDEVFVHGVALIIRTARCGKAMELRC